MKTENTSKGISPIPNGASNGGSSSSTAAGVPTAIPVNPFSSVLAHSYRDSGTNESAREDRSRDRSDKDSKNEGKGEDGKEKHATNDHHRAVERGSRTGSSTKHAKPETVAYCVQGMTRNMKERVQFGYLASEAVSKTKSSGPERARPNTAFVLPNAVGAEKAMREMERLTTPPKQQAQGSTKLPSAVINQIVSHVFKYQLDPLRQGLLIHFKRDALGGEVKLRLQQNEQGGTDIHFEGEAESLGLLEQHREELEAALFESGKSYQLTFG
jgi:hypothetical protein